MTPTPLIGLVMGSDSDWPVMQAAARILKEHGVPYEARVVSAHRTPDLLFEYAASARERGPACHHRRCRWRRPPAGHGCRQDHSAGIGGADPDAPAQGDGLPALHRADAQGRTGRHLRHR